jgi:hypothetical protein
MYPMPFRARFVAAYAVLAIVLAGSAVAAWRLGQGHRPGPLAPGAVAVVESFLGALQQGDLTTACRLFSGLPACAPGFVPPPLREYEVLPAEPAVGGVDVPATLNGEHALFLLTERLGRYRIVDVVADPAAFSAADLPAPSAL